MSFFIKCLGLGLLVLLAIILSRRYKGWVRRRLREGEGFIDLLLFMEGKIGRYLTPRDELFRDFDDPYLARGGFLDGLRCGEEPTALFARLSDFALGSEAKELVEKFFRKFGQGYKDEVLSAIRETREELGRIVSEERAGFEKNEKVVSAVLLALSLGAVILLI